MKRLSLVLAATLVAATACQDFLDVNENPNGPQTVSANLYLPPMLYNMATGPQLDGRFVGRYTQQWTLPGTSLTTWDRMGYDPGSDNAGEVWRNVYWMFGQNLVDMMDLARAEERWDILGLGYVLKAWGWQSATDLHGEIIVKEAIDQTKFTFNYDTQEFAYEEVRRLLDSAIVLLQRADGRVDASYMARGDRVYNGDRAKWLRFAYGMRARNLHHYTNKSSYNADAVIAAVDNALASNADDALMSFPGASVDNQDRNFWGRTRANITSYRQTQFVVDLMNGVVFPGAVDPRLSRMLSPSPDGAYRGLDPDVIGFGALSVTQRPNNPHGYPGTEGVGAPGRYLFDDKTRLPIMTYSELQFIKAEAAFLKGNKALALDAYRNAISSHIDFVNARNSEAGGPAAITAAEKAAFLANTTVVPTDPNRLTLTQIMTQKYLALWAWGHIELWLDMRRYDYVDLDPATGAQVYPGFQVPTSLYPDNAGKPVERIRPRYNSEYVWNRAGLDVIGGLALDYHTKPMWITEP